METSDFDALTQSLAKCRSRRGIARLLGGLALGGPLAILPLPGVLTAVLANKSEAAKRRRRATPQRRAAHRGQLQAQAKRKKKCAKAGQTPNKKRKRCCRGLVPDGSGACARSTSSPPQPGCTPATCAPTACGSVPDGCGGMLSCGGCGSTSLCLSGTCQPCDVCPSGCLFTSVAQAVAAASAGETIRICSGLYRDDIVIDKSLTLIGAGDGNGAGSTILNGSGTKHVVIIHDVPTVALERLRITGGAVTEFGAGIRNTAASLTLTGCTITGNRATGVSGDGGGIANFNSLTVKLINSKVTGNTAARRGGGILNFFGHIVLDATSRVTGNQASLTDAASGGGNYNNGGTVTLSSADNVSGNNPHNCGGTAVPQCVG